MKEIGSCYNNNNKITWQWRLFGTQKRFRDLPTGLNDNSEINKNCKSGQMEVGLIHLLVV